MITTTMTPDEVLKHILLDRPEIQRECVQYMAKGNCKEARTAKKFPLRFIHEYTATSGNHYLVMLTFNSRQDLFHFSAGLEAAAVIDTEHGKMMCGTILNMEDRHVHTFYFMPHLFKRYKERMGYKQDGIDLMRVFFKKNMDTVHMAEYRRKSKDDDTDVMLSCVDGAVFGYRHPQDRHSFVLMTFIANDTMQGGYKAKFNEQYNGSVLDGYDEVCQFFPAYQKQQIRLRKTEKKQTKK